MKSEFPYYVHLFDHMLCVCDQNSVTVTACPGHRAFLFHSPIAIPWYGFQLENPLPRCMSLQSVNPITSECFLEHVFSCLRICLLILNFYQTQFREKLLLKHNTLTG